GPTYAARARALQAEIQRSHPLDTIAQVLLALADPPGGPSPFRSVPFWSGRSGRCSSGRSVGAGGDRSGHRGGVAPPPCPLVAVGVHEDVRLGDQLGEGITAFELGEPERHGCLVA